MLSALLPTLVTVAFGAPEPDIEWSINAVCPGAELELVDAVVGYLNADANEFAAVEARVGVVDAAPAGLRLELEIDSRTGHEAHELAAIDCERLLDQAAVLIAGAIDPFAFTWPGMAAASEAAAEQHHRPMLIQHPRTPTPEPPPHEAPILADDLDLAFEELGALELAVPRLDRTRPPISGSLSVGATGFVGVFPSPGGGVELEGALERGRLRWQTGVGGWFGGQFRSTRADVGADLWALAFMSALCGVPDSRRIWVPLCATAGLGFMSARAVGTVEPQRDTRAWAWAGGESRVLFSVRENLAVGLGIGAMVALIRPAWQVNSPGVRFRVPPVMGVVRLTLETRNLQRRKNSTTLAIKPP